MKTLTAVPAAGFVLLVVALAGAVKYTAAPGKFSGQTVAPQTEQERSSHRPALDELYSSLDVPRSIPDGPAGVVSSMLEISDDLVINDLNLRLTITHTWIRDLRISLFAPGDTTEIVLLDLFPGDNVVNMTETWFNDESTLSIRQGRPPFTGRFRPERSFDFFRGRSAQGIWRLEVEDHFPIDTGSIQEWTLELNAPIGIAGTVLDGETGGAEPLSDVRVELVDSGMMAVTDTNGYYEIDAVPPSLYAVRFTRERYDTLTVPDVEVVEGITTTLNTTMSSVFMQYVVSSRNSAPLPIPDEGQDTLSVVAARNLRIEDMEVLVNVTHSYIGDVSLHLISPQGEPVTLKHVGDTCYAIGADLDSTIFDDQAERSFAEGTAPFSGRWRPHQALNIYFHDMTQGSWKLVMQDHCAGDVGTLDNFTLFFLVPESNPEEPGFRDITLVTPATDPGPWTLTARVTAAPVDTNNVWLSYYRTAGNEDTLRFAAYEITDSATVSGIATFEIPAVDPDSIPWAAGDSVYVYLWARDPANTYTEWRMVLVTGETFLDADEPRPQPAGDFVFHGSYPNPFNSRTEFRLDLARRARLELVLYNLLGQEVARVAEGVFEAGSQRISFDAGNLSSGLYLARATAGGVTQIRKVVLLR